MARETVRRDVPTNRSLAGLVLAGGYSTRFGDADKAVADLAGVPMIRRVVDRLAAVTDDVVVNCRGDQREAIADALAGSDVAVRFAVDAVSDLGPVEGIRAGLAAVDREYTAVVACDMPFVDPDLLRNLAARARGHDAAVVRLEDGWYQTTQAVYRTEPMRRACADALDSDDRRILPVIESIDAVVVEADDLGDVPRESFESIDTREDLGDAERRL